MIIGVPREIHPDESRVAIVPRGVRQLRKQGFGVLIERGAGARAQLTDAVYAEVGATIVDEADELWARADLILKVREPLPLDGLDAHEVDRLREGGRLICFLWPASNPDLLDRLAARSATVLAMDCVPRITRAQQMDAMSAMANISGYRAVIEAAHAYPHFFTGQITAAGLVEPAKMLVIGAGVAGLAAVGAAKGLGAIVRAFDTRLAVKEEVESLGGEFLVLDFKEGGEGEGGYGKVMSETFLQAEMVLFAQQAIEVDIIICTAVIPGREAPKLVTGGMVESMKEGSVIVDMAAEQGGNCVLTQPGRKIVHHGVTIIGYTDLPSRMATLASRLYSTTLVHFVELLGGAEDFHVDQKDDLIRGALVTHEGAVTWPPPSPKKKSVHKPYSVDFGARPLPETKSTREVPGTTEAGTRHLPWLVLAVAALLGIGWAAPEEFLSHFTVFVLACFVGWQVVWNVTPALHTPLMSVTNAISGIIVIGGMLQISGALTASTTMLGAAAILLAATNVSGGFLVTHRMLGMFRR